ncbi:serine hydrolase [Joostella atrarenae]|uniref:Serine hydrolase n=1 Tax=Joostella atrarenae TaxID=679257 RepID=A0ABS9J5T9_9FLAO|nr:serine hydrolase [Joostella atrarenae]MCF8715791.1 serine hydrolase [Joostella atrarenae]
MRIYISFIFLLLTISYPVLAQSTSEDSCVVLKNENQLLPIKDLLQYNIGLLDFSINANSNKSSDELLNELNKYSEVKNVTSGDAFEQDLLICTITSKNVDWELLYRVLKLSPKKKIILVSFIPLSSIKFNDYIFESDVLIQFDKLNSVSMRNASEIIFGGKACYGKLVNPIEGRYEANFGISLENKIRMGYGNPEEEGLNSEFIDRKVDSIMSKAIDKHAFPGAQLLVAKNNTIIYHKAFGYHTYDKKYKVTNNDLYDLASVTKITGPLPVLMQLVDNGVIDIDEKFSHYWKPWRKIKNKKDITVREVLAHQAGLEPYYIFLNEIIKDKEFVKRFVRNEPSKKFSIQIYKNLYLNNRFHKKMYRIINKTPVSAVKKYKYSGLTFLLYPEIISQLTGVSYEKYVTDSIYSPLGAENLMFNPSGKYSEDLIVPTELDTIYRKEFVKGWVHDENASLLGGVSGNAGLFGTANDLAKLIAMYQNMGTYGGKRYISEKTLKEFSKVQYPENDNKRGLGFDKPLLNNASLDISHASPAPEVSPKSFGHGGFTGTYVWADPENKLMFIFLSNRVYPTRDNRNLYSLNIRPSLQQVFYKASSVE